ILLNKAEAKKDTVNGIFGWHESIPEYLRFYFENSDIESLKMMLLYMCKDFDGRSSGFPDLSCVENGKLKFYEIKAVGDSLKQGQLLQILALRKAGFEVEVIQVAYAYNPDQVYVVV